MAVGVEAGHWLTYRIVYPDPYSRAQALAGSGHGYFHYGPMFFALVIAVGLCGFGTRVFGRSGPSRDAATVSLMPFVALSPLAFALQECLERLTVGSWPFAAVLAPTFMPGLLFQLPFAIAAYLAARSLLRAADRLRSLLSAPPRPAPLAEDGSPGPVATVHPRRLAALAIGYGKRGPPRRLVPAAPAASR